MIRLIISVVRYSMGGSGDLMHGSDDAGILRESERLAEAEPDDRVRREHGGAANLREVT
jgi:hypothetical protein